MANIDVESLKLAHHRAVTRAIKIHDALDIPYVTRRNQQLVEMLHGKILRVIDEPSITEPKK